MCLPRHRHHNPEPDLMGRAVYARRTRDLEGSAPAAVEFVVCSTSKERKLAGWLTVGIEARMFTSIAEKATSPGKLCKNLQIDWGLGCAGMRLCKEKKKKKKKKHSRRAQASKGCLCLGFARSAENLTYFLISLGGDNAHSAALELLLVSRPHVFRSELPLRQYKGRLQGRGRHLL